ncbi:MAG TPA: AraC family ligand binding domain-containing protein [Longimicrobiaceae bacterium]|nr:AraC family ligand binding domain-containing protein [Longimicrobiaceae bacterium]
MTVLPTAGPAARTDRHATELVHDEPNARVVCFRVERGQSVPPHTSESTVVVQVLEGEGIFRGEGSESHLLPGQAAVYAPGELHSMEPAGDGSLRFLAIITPRPT